jgi:protein ImuB
MLWAALLLSSKLDGTPPPTDALHGLALWALQFTPRVALVDEAAVMEVEASVRLFGGKRALRDRVRQESIDLGAGALAWASTSLGALALARAGIENGFKKALPDLLDGLPLEALTATRPHRTTLLQLGCQTLGQVRALPRGGISRRFDAELLTALDQAYGLRPPSHAWVTMPETFRSKLELMSRVEMAPELLFGARRLLMQMCGWLAARQAGTTAFTLRWAHDTMRARDVGEGGGLTIRTAEGTRDIEHLCRLLAENLAKVELEAPVLDLELVADDVRPLEVGSASLLPDTVNKGESLNLLLERMAARLGPERVLRPVLVGDHRIEWMQHWQPASEYRANAKGAGKGASKGKAKSKPPEAVAMPQPTFVLATPLRLAMRGPRPMYQGPLQLLAGPHRVEGGWWHRFKDEAGEKTHLVRRDYWVAMSEHAGFLWVFQGRLAEEETGWYLHGTFA